MRMKASGVIVAATNTVIEYNATTANWAPSGGEHHSLPQTVALCIIPSTQGNASAFHRRESPVLLL